MANDKRVKVNYTGVSCKTNGEFDMIVRIDSDTYHALRYHLQNSAEHHEYFSQIEDAVNLWQSLRDSWEQAREENERLEDEY